MVEPYQMKPKSAGNKRRRTVITVLGLSGLHFVLSIGSLLIAFSGGLKRFDHPKIRPGWLEQTTDRIAGVLVQPGASTWRSVRGGLLPNTVEWIIFLANSLLWGCATALIVIAIQQILQSPDKHRFESC